VRNVSFSVRPGEIVGLGGLVGAGRSETLETLFGLRPRQGGTVLLEGQPFSPRRPPDAVRAGLGFVAEDRRGQGIVPDFSVKENLLLAHLGASRGLGLNYGSRATDIDALLRRLDLPGERLLDANMLAFSGGMQQKIIIGRWLLLRPKVLLLDEPTKGVDIATRASIYAILREIAAEGMAIVVVSSDFNELLGLCSRIVVMSDGATLADLPAEILDEEKLTLLAAPRTSLKRTSRLLRSLAEDVGGAGFWALVDGERLCCLDSVVVDDAADPGFRAGGMPLIQDCRVQGALRAPTGDFVREVDGSRQTLLVPVRSPRGHDMGVIGVVLDGAKPAPAPDSIRSRVQGLFASES
jgi:ribose transport system ATP-binding protein/rhamnose transport system ATP-binding protein